MHCERALPTALPTALPADPKDPLMSITLHRLGHWVAAHHRRVLITWLIAVVAVLAAAGSLHGVLEDDFSIPGSESQQGIDNLATRFPQASGVTAQVVVGAPAGERITDYRDQVEEMLDRIGALDQVVDVEDPFADESNGSISPDGRYALSVVQLDEWFSDVHAGTIAQLEDTATIEAPLTVNLGGQIYGQRGAGISATELIGVAVAFVVLLVTFSSALAAGLPLLMSLLGSTISLAGILILAAFTTVSTSAPSLALMIGMAVGIDYGLFIVSRYRAELAGGAAVPEAMARSMATAGSATIFAGVTVIIALCGLALGGVPFLAVMGLTAAAAVLVAVLGALTLLPAILRLFGERLRPRPPSPSRTRRAATGPSRWTRLIERHPWWVIVMIVAGLAVAAVPVKDLELALPDNGTAEPGTPARETFDLIADAFGPGYNAPLVVTADMITSTDPRGTVDRLADELGTIDGVAAVTRSTPNPGADMALVRIIPDYAQSDPRTHELVQQIRDDAAQLERDTGVSNLVVTGVTAVSIDVSARLTAALLPFALVVVGMSFLLAMVVFRSIAIPLKATIGFVLSVGAAFGTVSAIYSWGWFADLLAVQATGPVLSFLPIIAMGVMFGLSMDYEVFLVSRIRESYVRSGDAQEAIRAGYRDSGRVVNAAGVIMIAVFAAFIPHGSATIKPIAITLAVGVFVDAFIIRATLARAVLVILGDRAWWMPQWLDRHVPRLDVEGVAVEKAVAATEWSDRHGPVAVRTVGAAVTLPGGRRIAIPDLLVRPGDVAVLSEPDRLRREVTAALLTGRAGDVSGTVEVLGTVQPEEAARLRRLAVACTRTTFADTVPDARLGDVVRLFLVARGAGVARRSRTAAAVGRAEALRSLVGGPPQPDRHPWTARTTVAELTALERRLLDLALADAAGARLVVVDDVDVDHDGGAALAAAAATLADAHRTVVLAGRAPTRLEAATPAAPPNRSQPADDALGALS